MIRVATYFGLWTALCMLMAIVVFFATYWLMDIRPVRDIMTDNFQQDLRYVADLAPYCLPAGLLAGFGWWLFHRKGRQPGWLGYGLFAIAVLLAIYVLMLGWPLLKSSPFSIQSFVFALFFGFKITSWVTVPMALAGTYLFVYWIKRRQ